MKEKEYTDKMEQVRQFARRCGYEREHSEQAARLAMRLFDETAGPLSLDLGDRFLLESAAVLHDIGWREGQQKHHKTAMRMILEDDSMPLGEQERRLVALIARYHRKALPRPDHPYYPDLDAAGQRKVDRLAGLLRVADGLDRSYSNAVEEVKAKLREDCLEVVCRTRGPAEMELRAAQKKADLLERALGREVRISRETAAAS